MSTTDSTPLPSIGTLIREAVVSLGVTDARTVASQVAARIAPEHRDHYLVELLVSRVSSEVSTGRTKVTPPREVMSTKQHLIRTQYWPRFLAQSVTTADGYKRLGDCTAEDLLFLADVRAKQANELMMRSDQFRQLAGLVKKHRVRVLRELDPSSGEAVLDAA